MTQKVIIVSDDFGGADYGLTIYNDSPVGWYRFKELHRPGDNSPTSTTDKGPLGLTFSQLQYWWDTVRKVINTMEPVYQTALASLAIYWVPQETEGDWYPGSFVPADAAVSVGQLLTEDEPHWGTGLTFYWNNARGWRDLARLPIRSNLFKCPLGQSQSWSLEFWIKSWAGEFSSDLDKVDKIIKGGTDNNNHWSFEMTSKFTKNGSTLNWSFRIGDTNYLFAPVLEFPDAGARNWHHYVITYAQSTNMLRLYIDGVEVDSYDTGNVSVTGPDGSQYVWLGIPDNGLVANDIPLSPASFDQSARLGLAELAYYDYCLLSTDVQRHFAAAP